MSTESLRDELNVIFESLSLDEQKHLVDLAKQLHRRLPAGIPGTRFIDLMDRYQFAPGAVDEMMQIIEEGCARIDEDDWR